MSDEEREMLLSLKPGDVVQAAPTEEHPVRFGIVLEAGSLDGMRPPLVQYRSGKDSAMTTIRLAGEVRLIGRAHWLNIRW